jgi:hypothetical protein
MACCAQYIIPKTFTPKVVSQRGFRQRLKSRCLADHTGIVDEQIGRAQRLVAMHEKCGNLLWVGHVSPENRGRRFIALALLTDRPRGVDVLPIVDANLVALSRRHQSRCATDAPARTRNDRHSLHTLSSTPVTSGISGKALPSSSCLGARRLGAGGLARDPPGRQGVHPSAPLRKRCRARRRGEVETPPPVTSLIALVCDRHSAIVDADGERRVQIASIAGGNSNVMASCAQSWRHAPQCQHSSGYFTTAIPSSM